MAKWSKNYGAVRWTLLFLLVVPTLVQSTETEENFEGTTSYAEDWTDYPKTTTNNPTSNTKTPEGNTTDPQRSERMVIVYVKPNPEAETKNLTDFLNSDDVVYSTGDKETIIVTDSEADEDEEIQSDGDLMVMEGRSLKDNVTDKLPTPTAEFESKNQPNSINREFNLKDVFNKWNSEIDFNLKDLLKVNLARLLADEYEEMNRLMNENLVEDSNQFMHETLTDVLEPRDADDGKDLDQTAEGTSEVVQQVLPVPVVTLSQVTPFVRPNALRNSGQIIRQYTYPVYQPNHRSDGAPSYILLRRTGNSQSQTMALLPTGNAMRLPVQSLPRTVAQRTQTMPPLLLRRPQTAPLNQTTARPPSRFGERFRLPRPFQYVLNMTIRGRRTTEKPPQTFLSSSISHLPSPSQNYPSRVPPPNRHFSTSFNNLPVMTKNPGVVATTGGRTTRPHVTTAAPSSYEFGARIRPFQFETQRNSTNVTQNKDKVNRDMKINQLRSNLVGKLVVMQSILDKKQEKSRNQGGKLASTQLNRNGLPNGILKPIVPLRPKVAETELAEYAVPDTTTETEFSLKDKKKYRRPPSYRKGGNFKLSAEKQTEDVTPSNPTKNRESMIVMQIVEATTPSIVTNTTESSATVMTDLNDANLPENTTETIRTTETNNGSAATTAASEILAVETSSSVNIPDLNTNLQETTLAPVHTENATETAILKDIAKDDGQLTSSSISELEETPPAEIDQETTLAPVETVENSIETSAKNEQKRTSLSTLQLENTSTANIDRQETTWATVVTVENATETASTKGDEVSNAMSELVTQNDALSVETTTENLLKENAFHSSSTFAPEDDPYLKAMIERALQLSDGGLESKASSLNQKQVVWTEDFLDDDDEEEENEEEEEDEELDLDFPDGGTDGDIEKNQENSSTSTILRFDRSVGRKGDSNLAVDSSVSSRTQDISPVNLARGSVRPIKLPYNILPDNDEIITR